MGVFSLGGWSRRFHARFLVSRATQDTGRVQVRFAYGGVTLCAGLFHVLRLRIFRPTSRSYNPRTAGTALVWAFPRSLATTSGITFVFFSWGYLDVSVPPVRPILKDGITTAGDGFPHSEISGSSRICRSPELIVAYHVLLRLHEPRYPPFALLSFPLLLVSCDTEIRFLFSSSFQHVKDH